MRKDSYHVTEMEQNLVLKASRQRRNALWSLQQLRSAKGRHKRDLQMIRPELRQKNAAISVIHVTTVTDPKTLAVRCTWKVMQC